MQNKPKPHPTPKAFDVFKPGKAQPTATSRPVIVSHRPVVQDSTVVDRPGDPIANSHQIIKHSQSYGRGGQHKEVEETAPEPTQTTKPTPSPSAGTHHSRRKPTLLSLGVSPEEAHRSRTGHTIPLPTSHKAAEVETEPEIPTQMAAEPIVPTELPTDQEKPTEGKAELLAALPIELRRSIASDQGNLAAGFDQEPISLQQPQPKQPTSETHDDQQHQAQAQQQPAQADPDPEPEQHVEQQGAVAAEATLAAIPDQQPDRRRYEGAVFIIMFVLFLLLTTVVVMLFLSGSISI